MICNNLRVICKATPEDKLLFIAGTRETDGLIAMTGNNVSDTEALNLANVGIALGSGCIVAKD